MPDISHDDISTVLNLLKKIPLFAELNEEDHREIIKKITLELFPANYVIFREGDMGDAFFIIKSGMVRIFHPAEKPEDEKEVAMLGDNDFFGEMALISEKPRNASIKTVEETQCYKLAKEDFIKLTESNHNMATLISSTFLKRLKENMRSEQE